MIKPPIRVELDIGGKPVKQTYTRTLDMSWDVATYIRNFVLGHPFRPPVKTAWFFGDLSCEIQNYLMNFSSRFKDFTMLHSYMDLYGFWRHRATVSSYVNQWKLLIDVAPVIEHVVNISKLRRMWCLFLRKLGIEPHVDLSDKLTVEIRVWESARCYYAIPLFSTLLPKPLPYTHGDPAELIGVERELSRRPKRYRERIMLNDRLNILCEELER